MTFNKHDLAGRQRLEDELNKLISDYYCHMNVDPLERYLASDVGQAAARLVKKQGWGLVRLLHRASADGHEGVVTGLLRAGVDIDEADAGGKTATALIRACRSGQTRIVRILLEYGADQTKTDDDLRPASYFAWKEEIKNLLQDDALGRLAVYFALDKATLRAEAEPTLQRIRELCTTYCDLKLEVQGHTDSSGAHEHNQRLSEERAAAVKAWLVAHRIEGDRLTTAGYAETRPVAPNTSPDGRQKNRRVELARR